MAKATHCKREGCKKPRLPGRGIYAGLCEAHREEARLARRDKTLPPQKLEQFLNVVAEGNAVETAAKAIGTYKRRLQYHRQRDEDFALAWADAIEAGADTAEQKVWDIALGRVTAEKTQLTACFGILRARRPAEWRDNYRVEHTGVGGGKLEVTLAFDPDAKADLSLAQQ